jgi:hypothetical protein
MTTPIAYTVASVSMRLNAPSVSMQTLEACAASRAGRTTPSPSDAAVLSGEKSTIWWRFHRRHHLTLRDRQFIENLTDRHKPLSPKQQKWLCDIREKLERGAAA